MFASRRQRGCCCDLLREQRLHRAAAPSAWRSCSRRSHPPAAYTETDGPPPPAPGQYPPQPGYPPPPGYGPPPDPYNYGVPPGTPYYGDLDDWEEGDPIPPGYRPDTRIRKGLVIGGAATMGGLWLISVVVGALAVSIEEADDAVQSPGEINTVTPEDWYPMFAPVVGPFITIATVDAAGGGLAFLLIDGIGQAGGLAMLIAGLAAQETYLRPAPYGYGIQITPVVSPGFTGLKGTF